jgi:hypothetical protein
MVYGQRICKPRREQNGYAGRRQICKVCGVCGRGVEPPFGGWFLSFARRRPAGSGRCRVGYMLRWSLGARPPAVGRASTFACLWRGPSLFDPRRRRGRILRDVPRPDADRRITARSDSHPISLMGAKRSGARRPCGVDGASTVIAWTVGDKIVCAPQAHAALLATGMEAYAEHGIGKPVALAAPFPTARPPEAGRRKIVGRGLAGRGLTPWCRSLNIRLPELLRCSEPAMGQMRTLVPSGRPNNDDPVPKQSGRR